MSHNVSRPCIDIDAWSASYKTEALTRGTKGKGDGVSALSLAYAIFSTYMLDNYQTRSQSETRNRFVYLSFPSLSYSNVFKCLREERNTFRCQRPTPRRFALTTVAVMTLLRPLPFRKPRRTTSQYSHVRRLAPSNATAYNRVCQERLK